MMQMYDYSLVAALSLLLFFAVYFLVAKTPSGAPGIHRGSRLRIYRLRIPELLHQDFSRKGRPDPGKWIRSVR